MEELWAGNAAIGSVCSLGVRVIQTHGQAAGFTNNRICLHHAKKKQQAGDKKYASHCLTSPFDGSQNKSIAVRRYLQFYYAAAELSIFVAVFTF